MPAGHHHHPPLWLAGVAGKYCLLLRPSLFGRQTGTAGRGLQFGSTAEIDSFLQLARGSIPVPPQLSRAAPVQAPEDQANHFRRSWHGMARLILPQGSIADPETFQDLELPSWEGATSPVPVGQAGGGVWGCQQDPFPLSPLVPTNAPRQQSQGGAPKSSQARLWPARGFHRGDKVHSSKG